MPLGIVYTLVDQQLCSYKLLLVCTSQNYSRVSVCHDWLQNLSLQETDSMVKYTFHYFHITINVSSSAFRGHENNVFESEESCLLGCHTM